MQAVVDMAVDWDTKAGQFDTVKQAIIDATTHDEVLAQKIIIDNFNL